MCWLNCTSANITILLEWNVAYRYNFDIILLLEASAFISVIPNSLNLLIAGKSNQNT